MNGIKRDRQGNSERLYSDSFFRRPGWRLLRRIGQFIDPESVDVLARVEGSIRPRVPNDAPLERRLGAEAIDSFLEHSASFPALVRGLSTGNTSERLVAVDFIQELAIRDMELARDVVQKLEQDTDPQIALQAYTQACILNDPGYSGGV